ncbi:DUF3048 domain-containing protein [Candidatus Parcubacteria bacterium]|nr:DUF3048 domain-containing protein [Candidatus Parcubacteria bacterium]
MKQRLLLICGAAAIIVLAIFAWRRNHTIGIENESRKSVISGLPCETLDRRPIAVMLPSDPETRPLSGISQADLVIEMPVTPNGVTRFMAVYQCQTPTEIGSIRSAREDFIPLAAGFQAIYAHWGGEHGALAQLDNHVLDNVNALTYEGSTFYRKAGVKPPHNGFSTIKLILDRAKDLKYDLKKNFSGYLHEDKPAERNISNIVTLFSIDYPAPYNVSWKYNQQTNVYSRTRGGVSETDKNTGTQITASVVAVMHTTSHVLREGDQYIVVTVTGQGRAQIYQDGISIDATWKKDPARRDSPLKFYDANDNEIKFAPGQIWIEVQTNL